MARWTKQQIAATIDHAALKPTMTDQDIIENCELGRRHQVASVCVRPSDVALTTSQLEGSGVVPSMVVGFPHGAHRPEVKALEAKLGIEDGAKELDMVMNIGKFLSGDYDWVQRDIEAVVAEAKKAGDVLVKMILETCYLEDEHKRLACQLALKAGWDFVKTSTGFGNGGATLVDVALMKEVVGDQMGIKASGGIRDLPTARAFLQAGATRLGTSSGIALVEAKNQG